MFVVVLFFGQKTSIMETKIFKNDFQENFVSFFNDMKQIFQREFVEFLTFFKLNKKFRPRLFRFFNNSQQIRQTDDTSGLSTIFTFNS